jgi:hypothetical protein
MRPLFFTLLLSLSSAISLGAQGYEPLVKPGATWQIWRNNPQFGGVSPYGYRIGGDTLIAGQAYAKLYLLDLYGEYADVLNQRDLWLRGESLFGALREDTAARKVFLLDFGGHPAYSGCDPGVERLIFDFNLAPGDTIQGICQVSDFLIENFPCIVDSIYADSLWGKMRRVTRCSTPFSGGLAFELLIEGIGFIKGPFAFGAFLASTADRVEFLHRYCALDIADDCSLILTPASEQHRGSPMLSVAPNPASETLYVLLKDERIAQRQGAQLRLLDLQGRPLRAWPTGPFDEVTSVLPLQGLPAGLYVLQYVGDGQVLGAERVVVRQAR